MPVQPTIERREDGTPGVRIWDPIDRQECHLETPTPVDPEPTTTDRVPAPVDTTVRVAASRVRLPSVTTAFVRDATGDIVGEAQYLSTVDLPPPDGGYYSVELALPIKVYLVVESRVAITNGAHTELSFGGDEVAVTVCARSYHHHPAATIQTPTDPRSVMDAVSAFGSALKTTGSERSYPTLRGHPPLIEPVASGGVEIPDDVSAATPDTGVTLSVPPTRADVYAVAPLAFYLGAAVTPADGADAKAVLRTGIGEDVPFDAVADDVHTAANRILQQCLLFDCCVRCEGFDDFSLATHRRLESCPDVPLDFADLYGRPLGRQLAAYLSVPWDAISDAVPTWGLRATTAPHAATVEILPFLADALALTTPRPTDAPDGDTSASPTDEAAAIKSFLREGRVRRDGSSTRDPASGTALADPVSVDASRGSCDAIGLTWVGPKDSVPHGCSRTTPTAHRNGLWDAEADRPLEITVVVNDPEMVAEGETVDTVYDETSLYDVEIRRGLTRDELGDIFGADRDFVHYIGHIRSDGFECVDRPLDADTLRSVGVDAFFLNACESVEQARALVERGSVAGIATSTVVGDDAATSVGATVARLLDAGFSVYSTLRIVRRRCAQGTRYVAVGAGRFAVSQPTAGIPKVVSLESRLPDAEADWKLSVETHAGAVDGVGGVYIPHVGANEDHYLCYGATDEFLLPSEEVRTFLSTENCPVVVDGELRWSDDLRFVD